MRVGVTGANGFVGKAVVNALVSAGYDAVPLIRKANGSANEVVIGDISDPNTLLPHGLALDAVIHLAALTHSLNDKASDQLQRYRAVNVLGTQNALELALINGAKRFIFLSSIKVNGESTQLGCPFTENSSPAPEDAYGISKFEAEKLVIKRGAESGLEIVIVRPPLIYGKGVRGNFPQLVKLVKTGLPLPFGRIRNLRSMIFVENLVNAIILCVCHPAAVDQKYLISDGFDLSTPSLIQLIALATGQKARMIPIPLRMLSLIARLFGQTARMARLSGSLQIDCNKICNDLGWLPLVSVQRGVELSVSKDLYRH